jgi:hypothetical protein
LTGPIVTTIEYPNVIFQQITTAWTHIFFNPITGGLTLTAGEYYFIFNGTKIPDTNGGNEYYFDVYGAHASFYQDLCYFDGSTWHALATDLLLKYSYQKYFPTTLNNIQINTVIGTIQTQFNRTTNVVNYSWQQSLFPIDEIDIHFTSNNTVRFNLTYYISIIQTEFAPQCEFQIIFPRSHVEWNNYFSVTRPRDTQNQTFYQDYNFTVQFPNHWFAFNATTEDLIISSSIPAIEINNSLSSLTWNYRAQSQIKPMILTTLEGRSEFAPEMNISALGTFNSRIYNATLSYWNANFNPSGNIIGGEYLENSTSFRSRSTLNQSLLIPSSVQFETFFIPDNFYNPILTTRVFWNNNTDAGVFWKNFSILQFSQLIIQNTSIYLEINGSVNVECIYKDYQNNPITSALISTNWTATKWTWTYTTGLYRLTFYDNNLIAGQKFQVIVNFSHSVYVSQWGYVNLTIYNFINTTLSLKAGDTTLYLGQQFDIYFQWTRWDSTPVNITNTHYTFYIDGISVPEQNGDIKFLSEPINVHVELDTQKYYNRNFVGIHQCLITLTKSEPRIIYQNQTYFFYFEVLPIPASLKFKSTTGTLTKEGIQVYERNQAGLQITMQYMVNLTYKDTIDPASLYSSGELYGSLMDLSFNQMIGMVTPLINHRDGSYSINFATDELIVSHEYEIRIWSNTTDFVPKIYTVSLILLSQRKALIDYTGQQAQTENQPLIIEGIMYFDDGVTQSYLGSVIVNITVYYSNSKGTMRESFIVITDPEGNFYDSHLNVQKADEYSYVNITILFPGNNATMAETLAIRIDIKPNWWIRYVIPIGIILLVLAIGIPLFIRYANPYLRKKLPESALMSQIQNLTLLKPLFEKKPEIVRDPLDEIQSLRIPRIHFKSDSISKVNLKTPVEYDILNLKELETIPEQEIKPKTIFNTQIINRIEILRQLRMNPLLKKEMFWTDAVHLEHRGDNFLALLKYLHALDNAQKIGNKDEIRVINAEIKRVFVDLPINQQIKFLRYRQRMKI